MSYRRLKLPEKHRKINRCNLDFVMLMCPDLCLDLQNPIPMNWVKYLDLQCKLCQNNNKTNP